MRTVTYSTLALLVALAAAPGASRGDLGPLEPLADFHRAVHEELGLPEPLIVRLLEAGTPDEHLPVIGHLARRAAVPPERIVELRRSGLSFHDIALRHRLGPEIFYVPFPSDPGPPYGKAWGYYKKTPRAQWHTIRLDDNDIVQLVNVRLVSDHWGVPPLRAVELRRQGKGFADVHHGLAKAKQAKAGGKGSSAHGDEHGKSGAKGGGAGSHGADGKSKGKGGGKGSGKGKGGGKG